jgi:hypothetical protein
MLLRSNDLSLDKTLVYLFRAPFSVASYGKAQLNLFSLSPLEWNAAIIAHSQQSAHAMRLQRLVSTKVVSQELLRNAIINIEGFSTDLSQMSSL